MHHTEPKLVTKYKKHHASDFLGRELSGTRPRVWGQQAILEPMSLFKHGKR